MGTTGKYEQDNLYQSIMISLLRCDNGILVIWGISLFLEKINFFFQDETCVKFIQAEGNLKAALIKWKLWNLGTFLFTKSSS